MASEDLRREALRPVSDFVRVLPGLIWLLVPFFFEYRMIAADEGTVWI